MWNGKNNAITFSYDDGVTQDVRLIEILNKYGLKGTFNLNSALLGTLNTLNFKTGVVRHDKVNAAKIKEIYAGHEIAVHTLTHPNLTELDEFTIVRQVEEDRKALESLCGYPIVGMAYPCGGVNNDDRVAEIIRTHTSIRYARTITSTGSFDLQTNLLRFNPTLHCIDENLESVVKNFLNLKTDKPRLLYIWGHSYEMDAGLISWERFEEICRLLAGREDIFYGTNREILL